MKKVLWLAVLAAMMASCSDEVSVDDIVTPTPELSQEVSSEFENGSFFGINQIVYGAPPRSNAAPQPDVTDFVDLGAATPLQNGLASTLTNEVFMKDFPNGRDNLSVDHPNLEELSYDFLYVSNGQPFEVYALYSHALYIDHVGIYWIDDEGQKHEKDFWSMADAGWLIKGVNPKDPYSAAEDVDTYNRTGEGFKFQLPKGWRFGFYVWNKQNGKKYSECDRNETTVTQNRKPVTVKGDKQVVTYAYQDINLIGFEDIFRSNGSDKDYNDIVLYVNPVQTVIPTGQVVVRWVDEDGVDLLRPEYSGEMTTGSSYTGTAQEIDGYELVDPTHTTETKTVNEYNKDNVITFVYKQKEVEYVINHICNDGCEPLKTIHGGGKFGETIYGDAEVFNGHVALDTSKEMVLGDDENVINLYYEHCETAYTVYYVEQGTNVTLADPTQEGFHKMGDQVTVLPKNIAGYTVVEYTGNILTLKEDAAENVFTFYYTKNAVEPDPQPVPEGDIVITLGKLEDDLICESDDFCIKYNAEELEYAYIHKSGTNLSGLKLERGNNLNIVISDIANWENGEKTYWQDLGNGMERACFDLRLYDIKTAAELAKLFRVEGIVKPEGYTITLDFSEEIKDVYYTKEIHISVLIDRPKK